VTTTKATLKTLASELGLSITTVSRALAGYSDVSATTRERVHAMAQQLGYVPNQSARRLVTGRSNAVGIVLPFPGNDSHDPYVTDPFINEILRHIAHALQHRQNLDLIVGYAHDNDDVINTYQRFVQGQRVDGFLLTRTYRDDPRVDYLLKQGIPFVCHGRTQRMAEHAWVDTDATQGFMAATQRLQTLNHQQITLLNIPEHFYSAALRAQGYTQAMHAAQLNTNIIHCELRLQSAYDIVLDLLRSATPPTAFLCASDILAVGALRAIRDQNRVPGRDISVIGTDDLPLARLLEPDLASLGYSFQHTGAVMMDMLHQQIAARRIIPNHKLIDFQLHDRPSLGSYSGTH